GQRDPRTLAGLARGRMKAKHDDLVGALDGMFDDHHGELAQMLLDQIAFCDARIGQLTARITGSVAAMPEAWGIDGDGTTGQAAIGAARTQTFLGERYHRIARRRGKAKAQVAVARSILGQVAGARYRAPAPSEPDLPVIPASGSSKPLRTLRVAAAVLCPCAAGPCGRGCRRRVPGLWRSSRSARRPARVFLARRVRAGCPGA